MKEADCIRNVDLGNLPEGKNPGDAFIKFHSGEKYIGVPIYKLLANEDGALNMAEPLLDHNEDLRNIDDENKGGSGKAPYVSYLGISNLRDGSFVTDEIMNAFGYMFNKREASHRNIDKMHSPGHMFSSHFIDKLCFSGAPGGATRHRTMTSQKYSFDMQGVKTWLTCKRVPKNQTSGRSVRTVQGGLDLFQCERIIFPYNVNNYHWVFFSINPMSLKQEFYDSLHGKLGHKSKWISECLHKWLLSVHKTLHGKNHPNEWKWYAKLIQSDPKILGNSNQMGTCDCLLHTCAVSVLLQDSKEINVLGTTQNEAMAAGIEIRRRIALTLYRKQFMLETRGENTMVDKNNGKSDEPPKNKTNVIDINNNRNDNVNCDGITDNEAKVYRARDRVRVHVIRDHDKNENTNDKNTPTIDKSAALKKMRKIVKTVIQDNKCGG